MREELWDALHQRRVVAVLGAGVSISTTGSGGALDWPALLEHALQHIWSLELKDNPSWKASVEADIALGREGDDTALLAAADKVTAALGGSEGSEFRSWLRLAFQGLEPRHEEVVRAIDSLNCPVLTTNYDDLYEQVTGHAIATWLHESDMQAIVALTSGSVGHLHGCWRESESLIFGGRSYGGLLAQGAAQAVQQAVASLKSLLFIGCGAGLKDPNLSALFRHVESIKGSEVRHYLLCRDVELAALKQQYSDSRITPVSYGAGFGDLAPFLRSLQPDAQLDRTAATPTGGVLSARNAVLERVQDDAILAEHLAARSDLSVESFLIPPVVLPVTPEQFAASRDKEPGERPERSDLDADLRAHDYVILSADEKAGLTSSLLWALAKRSASGTAVPVYIDFRSLIGTVRQPLERQIRRELLQGGAISDPAAPLPNLIVAIDNFGPKPSRIFSRALAELVHLGVEGSIFGVRRGDEGDVAAALHGLRVDSAVRYLGRLNGNDVRKLARLISPSTADDLAERAVSLLHREHLARTPLTVCLILSAMLHGESLVSGSSETMLLDAYVNLLMGRGDPHDDARFSLDSVDRTAVLAALADRFVALNVGSVSETVAVETMQAMFDAVSWSEDPVEVLTDFQRRGLLTLRSGQVSFAQSSYLHLFAAKRAMKSLTLKSRLFEAPFAYASIIRHYAALTRDDASTLERVENLLWAPDQRPEVTSGVFAQRPAGDVLATAQSVDELVNRLDAYSKAPNSEIPEEDGAEEELDILDGILDVDVAPFPAETPEEQTPIRRAVTTLSLVSNVLRDSELVEDLALKRRVFTRTVSLWALLAQLIESDEDYVSSIVSIADSVADDLGLVGSQRENLRSDVAAFTPIMISSAGMSLNLSSKRLFRHVLEAAADESYMRQAGPAVMIALLAFDIGERKWGTVLAALQREHSSVAAVNRVLHRLLMSAYMVSSFDADDEEAVVRFLAEQELRTLKFDNELSAKDARARIMQRLRRNRLRSRERTRAKGRDVQGADAEGVA